MNFSSLLHLRRILKFTLKRSRVYLEELNFGFVKTRTTIVVSNGRYTFYQIPFIQYLLSNTIYQIPFIKYLLSNIFYQIPFIKHGLSNAVYQMPFIKYYLQSENFFNE